MTLEELLRQGKSFGQGASNAAASTVTGPVDMLAWLLRKGGVNVGDAPMGGEAWMRQKGLMATPENRLAGLLGEGAGLAAPIVAAAKAPEIAGGLLQMGRNLAAPQTMNKQTGAIVYHGSPHKFDKFDASKIGTGEGAQAYGHGLYLAESDKVAGEYANMFAKSPASPAQLLKLRDAAPKGGAEWSHYDDLVKNGQGSLYKVDLPDDAIAKMLDWDKPLSQQPKEVQKALANPVVSDAIQKLKQSGQLGDYSAADLQKLRGEDYYDMLRQSHGDSNIAPSAFLQSQGIPGIRYLDGGSRGAGQGSSNFVVFPGNEGLLSILERNGKPIK